MADLYNLDRFVSAQDPVIEQVRSELRAGNKQSHWMWFIFPQWKGLGSSHMANFYGIGSRAEACAYLEHPVLGARLKECTQIINSVEGKGVDEILGYPDDLKFKSSMTLFAEVAPEEKVFAEAMKKFFGGKFDQRTLDLLQGDTRIRR